MLRQKTSSYGRSTFPSKKKTKKLKLVNTKINVNIKEDLGDDEDLACIIWPQGFKVDLPIVVDTSQQPFSSWSANEATRCEYISRIIYGVASIYGGEIKVYPQYEISGSHGKGPVDWAIKIGNIIITITEAKKEDINQGIAQNAIQLQTSIQHNPKKRSYDAAGLHEDVIYGIVSTAVDWIIIKLVSSNSE
ncbi:unnamed protein product [Rhizophagus irregularis]|nr:unnamed protein product [Rhizophagus irregularis]